MNVTASLLRNVVLKIRTMAQGWIKLHRKITEHWLYQEKRTFSKFEAWQDLLLHTNHAPNKFIIKGDLISLDAGQSARSQVTLATTWNWSRKKVSNFLKLLEKDQMICLETTKNTSVITIVNWQTYQENDQKKSSQTNSKSTSYKQHGTSKEHQKNITSTSEEHQKNIEGTSEEHQKNTNKNDKNIKNDNNVKNDKNFLQQKKNQISPDEIEISLRQFFNENEHIKRKMFADVEKSSGRPLSVEDKKAIAQRVTVFANDYVLRPNWDSTEAVEKKVIRFTNYIINSIKNGYELTNDKQSSTEQKGFRVSKEFENLLSEIESEQQHRYGYMENDPFDRNSQFSLARANRQ